jgi:hypothetical protein
MRWRLSNATGQSLHNTVAASLLDALERIHPIREGESGAASLGRWLIEVGDRGVIADDTVVWLHRMLLPDMNDSQPGVVPGSV